MNPLVGVIPPVDTKIERGENMRKWREEKMQMDWEDGNGDSK
jgi:hypothetical protein